MTLTDFLLARVAEDEAWANDVLMLMIGVPARVLAECEAKRRIVDWCRTTEGWVPTKDERAIGSINANRMSLRFLALPYANHPDYREEWKP